MRTVIVALLFFVAALSALLISYPFAAQYEGTEFSRTVTLGSYLLLAAITAAIAITIDEVAVKLLLQRIGDPVARWFAAGVLVFIALAALALAFGVGMIDIPGTRIHGIFFAEWQFFRFIGFTAIPLSVLASIESATRRHGLVHR